MADIVKTIKEELTLEKVLLTAIKTPGVKIRRSVFLRKELLKYCPEETINRAIQTNPAQAGISKDIINKVSKKVIDYETTKVTALSVAASLPSAGVAAVGAAAADITSYFVFILRTVQELAYLYGFEQFDFSDETVDSETMQFVLLFLGVMFGVRGAAAALQKLAAKIAEKVAKDLARKALMKGAIYPIIKRIATQVGIRMTKQVFADVVASAVPVAGSVVSGGLTFAMFRPCCMKLRRNLMSFNLCDPEYYKAISAESINEGTIQDQHDTPEE